MAAIASVDGNNQSKTGYQSLSTVRSRGVFAVILALLAALDRQVERHRSRRLLLEMTDEQLKDIGLSRGEAFGEGAKRWWE